MCLKIGKEDFCYVLTHAPFRAGKSLERIQHEIEENQYPMEPEVVALIANVCGLSLEEYHERNALVRGKNAVEQAGDLDINYLGRFMPTFEFPVPVIDWVRGKTHVYPGIEHLDSKSAELTRAKLWRQRFRYFRHMLHQHGDVTEFRQGFRDYPERFSWLIDISNEPGSTNRWKREAFLRKLFSVSSSFDITPEVRLSEQEISYLVAMRRRYFLRPTLHQPDRSIVESLLSSRECEELERFSRRWGNILPKGGTRRNKNHRRKFLSDLGEWSNPLYERHGNAFAVLLREHLLRTNLVRPSELAVAA